MPQNRDHGEFVSLNIFYDYLLMSQYCLQRVSLYRWGESGLEYVLLPLQIISLCILLTKHSH